MKCCSTTQGVLIISSGALLTISLLVFIIGYAVPKAQLDGYQARFCLCHGTNITDNGSPYYGYADLEYGLLFKNVRIIGSKSRAVVQSYLSANYRNGTYVPCYVSPDDIEVALFTNVIALIFGSVTLILGVCLFMAFVVFTIRYRRRMRYAELQDPVTLPPPKSPFQKEVVIDLPLSRGSTIRSADEL